MSDRPPSRFWLSVSTVSDMDESIVEADEYSLIIDYLSNWAEFIEGSLSVKGRLKQCVSHWESTIAASRFVLDVISEGYRLALIWVPDPLFITNNRSAELLPSCVEETVVKLLAADCIEERLDPPYRMNPLT